MLTNRQKADVRRFAGYPLLADQSADASRDFAYGWVLPGVWQTLAARLDALRPEEEETLLKVYLSRLLDLEAAIADSSDNLDTKQAAVWTHNANEVSDRAALFDQWRVRMCEFIGIAPGPALAARTGGHRILRG